MRIDQLINKANVTTNHSVEKYIGLTANKVKDRYGGHKQDFKAKKKNTPPYSQHTYDPLA